MSHEEVTIEREPITETNRGDAYDGPDLRGGARGRPTGGAPGGGHEAVALERVRMGTNTVQGQETVTGEVRKEVIDTDEDTVHGVRDDRDDVRDDARDERG